MTTWRSRIVDSGEEDPEQLLANPRNWRIHPKAQQDALGAVLEEVGWVQQVIVNRTTGYVIDGHLRVALAISRGESSVPVLYVELTAEEEALVLAALDPLAGMAVTDAEMYAALTADLSVTDADLRALLGLDAKAGRTDPDEVPEPPAEPITKPGDLWELGEHRLLCEDATDAAAMAVLMEGRPAVCLWTDPPYGVGYVGKTEEALTIANDAREDDLPRLLGSAFKVAGSALEPGAPFYVAAPPGPQGTIFRLALDEAGLRFHQALVWVKDSMVLGHSDYHYRHEDILYGWVPGEGRSGRGRHEGSRWYGDNARTSVLEVERPKASREHPTMKPVALIRACLANSARSGEIVLDTFAGSGSTLFAADELGQVARLMEIDPAYCDVIVTRWESFTGKEAQRG